MRKVTCALAVLGLFAALSAEAKKCPKQVPKAVFDGLEQETDEITHAGWSEIDIAADPDGTERLANRGKRFAILVNETDGHELVMGWVYEIEALRPQVGPTRRLVSTRVQRTLVVSLVPPRFELDGSEGRTRWISQGWGRRPNPKNIVRIPFDDIAGAKYFVTERWE